MAPVKEFIKAQFAPPSEIDHRRSAELAIEVAMKGVDGPLLERALKTGLDAGVADALLHKGLMRHAELSEQAASEGLRGETTHASHTAEARRSTPPKSLRVLAEGSLVKLHGLKGGRGPMGTAEALEKYNGRLGRVVEWAPPYLLKTAVEGAYNVYDLVLVLLDARASDRDRSSGLWLAVDMANLKPQ